MMVINRPYIYFTEINLDYQLSLEFFLHFFFNLVKILEHWNSLACFPVCTLNPHQTGGIGSSGPGLGTSQFDGRLTFPPQQHVSTHERYLPFDVYMICFRSGFASFQSSGVFHYLFSCMSSSSEVSGEQFQLVIAMCTKPQNHVVKPWQRLKVHFPCFGGCKVTCRLKMKVTNIQFENTSLSSTHQDLQMNK